MVGLFVVLFPITLLCGQVAWTLQSGAVSQRDASRNTRRSDYSVFTPDYLQIAAGTLNVSLHGIYERVDELKMSQDTVSWYGDIAARPVYQQVVDKEGSRKSLFIYWSPKPTPQWRLSSEYPVDDPTVIQPSSPIVAILPSFSYCPAVSRGWFVVPGDAFREQQLPLTDSALCDGGSCGTVRIPDRMGVPSRFQWDPFLSVDEARPGTFSLRTRPPVEPGCPRDGGDGTDRESGDSLDPCLPPRLTEGGVTGHHQLDFTVTGADGILRQALFSWAGYFSKRPFFELRSPVSCDMPHGTLAVHPAVLTFWAEGAVGRPPVWYISRELGNKDYSQLFARWALVGHRPRGVHGPFSADWPAELGAELIGSAWVVFRPPVPHSEWIGTIKEQMTTWPTVLQLRAVLPGDQYLTLTGGPADLEGEYFLMGVYSGYPYFRQKPSSTAPGFALFRSHTVAANRDCWVIAARLGSTQGLRAYACDNVARWPQQIEVSWWVWTKEPDFSWRRRPDVQLRLAYKRSQAVPAVNAMLFPPCPLPTCTAPFELPICPPSGTCLECACDKAERVRAETALRRAMEVENFCSSANAPALVTREVFVNAQDGRITSRSGRKKANIGHIVKAGASVPSCSAVFLILSGVLGLRAAAK